MRKLSTRKITTPANVASTPAKPVLAAAATAQAAAGRSNVAPAAKPAAPAVKADKPAKPAAGITRTAATVVAQRTNYGTLSDRDTAYIQFYAAFAKASGNLVTLASLHASGKRPTYAGSNKPHDAGVIVRLTKAGILKPASDGTGFGFTDHGKTLKAYSA